MLKLVNRTDWFEYLTCSVRDECPKVWRWFLWLQQMRSHVHWSNFVSFGWNSHSNEIHTSILDGMWGQILQSNVKIVHSAFSYFFLYFFQALIPFSNGNLPNKKSYPLMSSPFPLLLYVPGRLTLYNEFSLLLNFYRSYFFLLYTAQDPGVF